MQLRILGLISLMCLNYSNVLSQNGTFEEKDSIKLTNWNAANCDNTYDPYRLINRISDLRTENGHTFITISFSDNCCADFIPQIQFKKNQLFLMPYKDYEGDYCDCNCCFSIQYEIQGLATKNYDILFNGEEIKRSDDHYKVYETSYEEYNGQIINKRNKYGFYEGIKITFHENGKPNFIFKYPDNSLYYEPKAIWSKRLYPSGAIAFHERNDTTEYWSKDGLLKSQQVNYKTGDTTFSYVISRYPNGQLSNKSLEKRYAAFFTSEFDPDNKWSDYVTKTVYKEEYFKNGQPKFIYGVDTTFSWYESGQIKSKGYAGGSTKQDENGHLIERTFNWKTKYQNVRHGMDHHLYVDYYLNGNFKQIHYSRDEPTENGHHPDVHYYWKWNDEKKLTESPENWNEELPWDRLLR